MYTLTGINTTTNKVSNSPKLPKTSSSGVVLTTPQQREIISKKGNKALSNIFFGGRGFQSAQIREQKNMARIALEVYLGEEPSRNLNRFKQQCKAILVATQRKIMNKNDKEILTKFFTPSEDQEILEEQTYSLQDLLKVAIQKIKSFSDLGEEHPQTDVARIALEAFLGKDSSNNPNLFYQQCEVLLIATIYEIMNKDDKEILTNLFTPSEDQEVLEEQTYSLQDLLKVAIKKIKSLSYFEEEYPQIDVARIALEAFLGKDSSNNLNLFNQQCEVLLIATKYEIMNKDDKEILTNLFTPSENQEVLAEQNNAFQDLLKIPFRNIMSRIALEAFWGEEPSNNLNIFKKQCEATQVAVNHGIINIYDKEMLTKLYTPSEDPDILEVQNKSLINLVVNNSPKDLIGIALDAFLGEEPSNNLNLFKKQCEIIPVALKYIPNNNDENIPGLPAFVQIETQSLLEKLKKYDNMIHNRFAPTDESGLEEQSRTIQNLLAEPNQTKVAKIALESFFGTEPPNNLNLFIKQCEIMSFAFERGLLDEDDKEEILTILYSPSNNNDVLEEQSRTIKNLLADPNQTETATIVLKAFLEKDSTNNLALYIKQFEIAAFAFQHGILI